MTHDEALSAALEAARVKDMKSVKEPWVHELVVALVAERDEARREADDYLHELVDERARADDAFKLQAALREALDIISDHAPWGGSDVRDYIKWMQKVALDALTDTADAAAQWQRSFLSSFVDAILHGDPEHRGWLREAGENFAVGKSVPPPRGSGFAAAPKAGEPEG